MNSYQLSVRDKVQGGFKWRDTVEAPEAEEVIEAVVQGIQAVRVAAVLQSGRRTNRLRDVITVPIMTGSADYIRVIQAIAVSEPKADEMQGLSLHLFL